MRKFVVTTKQTTWQNGIKNSKGYGIARWKGSSIRAHRLSFIGFVGPIGDFHVLHKCNNPSCANPGHLYLGSNQQNVDDRETAGHGLFRKGHLPKNSRLDNSKAKEIKEYIRQNYPNEGLWLVALRFKVPSQTVKDIKNGRSYINA